MCTVARVLGARLAESLVQVVGGILDFGESGNLFLRVEGRSECRLGVLQGLCLIDKGAEILCFASQLLEKFNNMRL